MARDAIIAQFQNGWEDVIPVYMDNRSVNATVPEWARLNIKQTSAKRVSIGNPARYERRGRIILQIFINTNTGMSRIDELTERARNIFEGKRIESETIDGLYRDVSIRDGATIGARFNSIVDAEYIFWEIK